MSDKFVDSPAHFRLNACVQPPPSTEPNSSASVQNVTLTEKLVAAANEVTRRHRDLCDDRERRTTSDIVADFEFQSKDQAKRGELLLCEILARANPDVADKVIADFQVRVAMILNPIAKSLKDIKDRVSPKDPILKNLRTIQQAVKKTQDGVAAYVEEIKQQTASQAWEQVATTWVEMNRFLEGMKGLRRETLGVEVSTIRTPGSKPLGRLPTHPIEDAQIGPVVRTESFVRVSFDLFLRSWPAKFCRDIASTVNRTCPFPVSVGVMYLVYRFDGLLNQCESLKCRLLDDERFDPGMLLNIEIHFKDFIGEQASFCKQMQMGSNSDAGSEAITANSVTPIPALHGIQASLPNEEINRLVNFFAVLPAHLDMFESLIAQLGNRTTTLAKEIEPLTKIYVSEPQLAEIRKKALGQKVPECITDWVLSQFLGSDPPNMPTKGDVYRQFGPKGSCNSKLGGRGDSKKTFGTQLTIIRKLLVNTGLLAPESKAEALKRARNYDPGDDRQEDINQSDPSEQSADRDDADQAGSTTVNTLTGELGPGQAEQED